MNLSGRKFSRIKTETTLLILTAMLGCITGGDNGSGYSFEHTSIKGFAFTQMSGTGWYGDLGNFLVMPTTGELKTASGKEEKPETGYRSRYSKTEEKASAGYYGIMLTD